MRIELKERLVCDQGGIRILFDVVGDEHEPGAEEVLLGSGNLTMHSSHTAEEVVEAIWEEAEGIRDSGLASWELHNRVAPLLRQKEKQQQQ